MTHTPTPWKYEKYGNDTDVNSVHEIFTDCDTQYYIANVNRETNPKANAEFIVRACNAHNDLLAVAKFYSDPLNFIFMEGNFYEYGEANVDITQYRKMGTFAEKILAKAKGE